MTLKDKLQQWFINDEEDEQYKDIVELVSIEHEKLADEHAIGFSNWLSNNKYGYRMLVGNYSIEDILKIYKKEHNL